MANHDSTSCTIDLCAYCYFEKTFAPSKTITLTIDSFEDYQSVKHENKKYIVVTHEHLLETLSNEHWRESTKDELLKDLARDSMMKFLESKEPDFLEKLSHENHSYPFEIWDAPVAVGQWSLENDSLTMKPVPHELLTQSYEAITPNYDYPQ